MVTVERKDFKMKLKATRKKITDNFSERVKIDKKYFDKFIKALLND